MLFLVLKFVGLNLPPPLSYTTTLFSHSQKSYISYQTCEKSLPVKKKYTLCYWLIEYVKDKQFNIESLLLKKMYDFSSNIFE